MSINTVWLQRWLPQRLLCGLIYRMSRSRVGWIKSSLISGFIKIYRVDVTEASEPDVRAYRSFNDFFVRELREDVRPIDAANDAVVSPVDGRLTSHGSIDGRQIIQAKGIEYAIAELLGDDGAPASAFEHGTYATIYLAPHNYHRVHMPSDAVLQRSRYIAGRRYAVNEATAARIPKLFCGNERLACWFDAGFGHYAMVLVGALNVSSISTTAHGEIASGTNRSWQHDSTSQYRKGQEFARFNLGSTVILLFSRDAIRLRSDLSHGRQLLLGQAIGSVTVSTPTGDAECHTP